MPNTPYGRQSKNSQQEQSEARSHALQVVAPQVMASQVHTKSSDMTQAGRAQAVCLEPSPEPSTCPEVTISLLERAKIFFYSSWRHAV